MKFPVKVLDMMLVRRDVWLWHMHLNDRIEMQIFSSKEDTPSIRTREEENKAHYASNHAMVHTSFFLLLFFYDSFDVFLEYYSKIKFDRRAKERES